jgi:hypothetical protein
MHRPPIVSKFEHYEYARVTAVASPSGTGMAHKDLWKAPCRYFLKLLYNLHIALSRAHLRSYAPFN